MVSLEGKRRLRKASKEQDRSMSAVVDELLKQLPEEPKLKTGPGMGAKWVKENVGILAGRLKPEDWDRQDRFGHLLRKHVPK